MRDAFEEGQPKSRFPGGAKFTRGVNRNRRKLGKNFRYRIASPGA